MFALDWPLTLAQIEEILGFALRRGGDFAELYLEKTHNRLIFCEDSRLERVTSGLDIGAGLRVVRGKRTFYAYTNDLTLAGLRAAARTLAEAVGGERPTSVIPLIQREPAPVSSLSTLAPADAMIELVLAAERAARREPQVHQVSVSYREQRQEVLIINSLGFFAEDLRRRAQLVLNAIAAAGGEIQTGLETAGVVGERTLSRDEAETMAARAAARATRMLSAQPAPTGEMPVVLSGSAGGTMIHEACGHGLEADLAQKGLSRYSQPGLQVAASHVTIIDDGTLGGKYGSAAFDDEGTPTRRTVLIENGVLKGYLHSLLTARQAGVPPTGNGRRESYRHKPIPRMTNTYLAPGTVPPEEILATTPRGLYVVKMGGGQVNTTNGDFVFEVTEGYLIEKGKIGPPVRGATLTGNGPQILATVDLIGTDLGFAIGTCGKDGQAVPVSDAQPTVRIPRLIVGGR